MAGPSQRTASGEPVHWAGVTYRERLTVPAGYWVVGLVVGVTTAVALGFYLGEAWAVGGAIATVVGVAAVLLWAGRTELAVDGEGIRAGRSLLEWQYVGAVEALRGEEAQRVSGPDADLRDFAVLRAWVRPLVRVTVSDAADPHPHWLLSTRRPEEFVRAVEASRPAAGDRRG